MVLVCTGGCIPCRCLHKTFPCPGAQEVTGGSGGRWRGSRSGSGGGRGLLSTAAHCTEAPQPWPAHPAAPTNPLYLKESFSLPSRSHLHRCRRRTWPLLRRCRRCRRGALRRQLADALARPQVGLPDGLRDSAGFVERRAVVHACVHAGALRACTSRPRRFTSLPKFPSPKRITSSRPATPPLCCPTCACSTDGQCHSRLH